MPGFAAQDSTSAVRAFRKALLEAVEELRPPSGTPEDDPAWRPYRVIWHRFVVGRQLAELEEEMALGRRQLQREQRRGLEVLGLKLWERFGATVPEDGPAPEALREEASRIARRQRYNVAEQLRRALRSVAPLAEHLGVQVRAAEGPGEAFSLGDASVTRQLIVAALSLALRDASGGVVSVSLQADDGQATLVVSWVWDDEEPREPTAPSASLLALAAGQGVQVTDEADLLERSLRLTFVPAPREHVIAFVEDNEDVVALFQRYLSGHGYALVGVSENEAVLERLAELQPDAILLDIMMQDLDGWEVLQRLKADPRLREVPIVVCSVLHEPELAMSLGASAYLCKPVRPARLLECLSALLPGPHSAEAAPLSAAPETGRSPQLPS